MRAIRIHSTGGPDQLVVDEIASVAPGPGEIRVAIDTAGVNFLDVYLRSGLYPPGALPARVGKEGAGTIVERGAGVERVRVGDRVAFCEATGAYAEEIVLPAGRALPLPESLSFAEGAALPLQGMTADYLVRSIGRVGAGEVVVVHAAAGGVGRLAVQLAKAAGATVFGTTSSAEKASVARAAGCDDVFLTTGLTTAGDFADAVLAATGGRGADLVLDSIGQATFASSVRATRVRGTLVLFGQSSGTVAAFSPRGVLGSRTLVTATLYDYVRSDAELHERWQRVVADLAAGTLALAIDSTFPLAAAAAAHRRLESRASAGKIVLAVGGGA